MPSRFFSFFIFLYSLTINLQPAYADEAANIKALEQTGCTAEILMEAESGDIIYEINSDKPLPPASMVKIMTTYITLQQVKSGDLKWDDIVTTSAFASKIGGSQVYLREKEQFTLRQMLDAVLIQSANDAATAIAEHIAGSQEGFVELMNAEAARLGMKNTSFHSAHGLPPAKDQLPDLVSARDMAILSRALITDFPEVLETTSKKEAGFRDGTFIMRNHNHLLHRFPGCDGIKTGYYAKAGFGVSTTALRKGVRLIAVVMGCQKRDKRDAEAARLLSSGFAKYRALNIVKKGEAIAEKVPVIDALEREISPIAKDDIKVIIKAEDRENVVTDIKPCEKVTAPVEKGSTCGEITVSLNGTVIGRTDLIIDKDLSRLGFKDRWLRKIGWF
jgi:D-alanyl-D-alanine carboxypeptidase (penicillin-binding protein 5/6)